MIADPLRRAAYQRALDACLRPGMTVLDLGAGYGALSFEALRRGARHVIAVEPAEAIEVGRALAVANGLADRITFHRALLQDVPSAQRVDLVMADLRGSTPFLSGHFEAIAHAREAWLAPEGAQIPLRDDLLVAAVRDAELVEQLVAPWGAADAGLDMSVARDLLAHRVHRVLPPPVSVVGAAQCWDRIDYTAPGVRTYGGDVVLSDIAPGPLHGLLVWFDALLAPGVVLSTAPGTMEGVYGRTLLPLARPLDLPAGACLEAHIRVTPVRGDWIWRWDARAVDGGGRVVDHVRGDSWSGAVVDPRALARRAPGARPQLSPMGRLHAFVLSALDGQRTVDDLVRAAQAAFPDLLPDADTAQERVGELIEKHGR
jgi:SAM-dependent methyltransferase